MGERGVAVAAGESGTTYFDRRIGRAAVKLLPGRYFATGEDVALVTVLGSCVSACLCDRERGIGGFNHFMLPIAGGAPRPAGSAARYGVQAMELLIARLRVLGARPDALEAKVFGGARILPGTAGSAVGERNAAFVLDFLAARGIPVVASDLLGADPRRICFFPASGRVLVKRLPGTRADPWLRRELAYEQRLRGVGAGS